MKVSKVSMLELFWVSGPSVLKDNNFFGRESVHVLKDERIYILLHVSSSMDIQWLPYKLSLFLLRFQHAMGGVPAWVENSKRKTSSDGEY